MLYIQDMKNWLLWCIPSWNGMKWKFTYYWFNNFGWRIGFDGVWTMMRRRHDTFQEISFAISARLTTVRQFLICLTIWTKTISISDIESHVKEHFGRILWMPQTFQIFRQRINIRLNYLRIQKLFTTAQILLQIGNILFNIKQFLLIIIDAVGMVMRMMMLSLNRIN